MYMRKDMYVYMYGNNSSDKLMLTIMDFPYKTKALGILLRWRWYTLLFINYSYIIISKVLLPLKRLHTLDWCLRFSY